MNKIINNNLYFLLSATLFALISLLNISNKLTFCAFIYVLIALIANVTSELYGKKKTLQIILPSLLVNFALLWNAEYYINNVRFEVMIAGSFLSVLISTYCSMSLFAKIKSTYGFHTRSLISLALGSIVDCCIMASVLLSKFPIDKVLSIFVKDIIFKFSYSLTISFCLILGFYILPFISAQRSLKKMLNGYK